MLCLHPIRQTHAGSSPFPAVYHLVVFTWRPINIVACPTLNRPVLISHKDQSFISKPFHVSFLDYRFFLIPSLDLCKAWETRQNLIYTDSETSTQKDGNSPQTSLFIRNERNIHVFRMLQENKTIKRNEWNYYLLIKESMCYILEDFEFSILLY